MPRSKSSSSKSSSKSEAGRKGGESSGRKNSNSNGGRGFAGMSKEKHREISRKGGEH